MPSEALQKLDSLMAAEYNHGLSTTKPLFEEESRKLGYRFHQGKVRESYSLPGGKRLIVATDRISTFDAVHPTLVPAKGIVLTQMTLEWFKLLKGVRNHFLTDDISNYPAPFTNRPELIGRSMIVKELEMIPAECIVRGNITGSAMSSYKKTGRVNGLVLPEGLIEADFLETPLFTPSTKAEEGHDINITYQQLEDLLAEHYDNRQRGVMLSLGVRHQSLSIFNLAREYAASRGVIIADTKFEFGLDKDRLVLGDEVLTPDSSRFWPAEDFKPGKSQPSFDKQYVRDYVKSTGWDQEPPAPALPPEVVMLTQQRYHEGFRRLFG